MFRDLLSPRRVLWLVEHLPANSAVAAALAHNPALREWDLNAVLLTGVFNKLSMVAIYAAQPHVKRKLTAPKPLVPPIRQRSRRGRVIDVLPSLPD